MPQLNPRYEAIFKMNHIIHPTSALRHLIFRSIRSIRVRLNTIRVIRSIRVRLNTFRVFCDFRETILKFSNS